MKTFLFSFLFVAVISISFFSCQKEISFDETSTGALEKDNNGNCLPPTIQGNYVAGKNLDGNNYIEVLVRVATKGTYAITSDTINGYFFKASGNFQDTGEVLVKLAGSGKPAVGGNNLFHIQYGASVCEASMTVLNANRAASFTLQGSPNTCMNDTVMGSYVQGYALDSTAKVKIMVDVTSAGTYSISTSAVNGYSFSSVGSFSTAGIQSVYLAASGTPLNAGTNVFTVTAGSSSCTFSVTVLMVTTTTNNDLFPLTMNSFWHYDLYHTGSTVMRTVIDTATRQNHLYRVMQELTSPNGSTLLYYRKSGTDYFENAPVDKYTGSFQYGKKIYGDLPFLKEGLNAGDSWESAEYNDTASFGQVILLKYLYSCLAADGAAVINGNAFAHVYKIQMRPQIRSVTNGYGYTGEIYNWWYAKGVGIIYYQETNIGSDYGEWQIKNWQVN